MTPILNFSAVPRQSWHCVVDVVPPRVLVDWALRLYTLTNLAWQYIDTVLDISVQMRQPETKKLVRAVRQIRREYDQFRAKSVDDESARKETERTELFEDIHSEDFRKLFFGLENEVGKLGLKPQHRDLLVATQQALTVMDSVKVYARRLDEKMRREYSLFCPDCSLVQVEFLRLYGLIPQFAGDCYRPDIEARRLTARILANRVESIVMRYEDEDTKTNQASKTA